MKNVEDDEFCIRCTCPQCNVVLSTCFLSFWHAPVSLTYQFFTGYGRWRGLMRWSEVAASHGLWYAVIAGKKHLASNWQTSSCDPQRPPSFAAFQSSQPLMPKPNAIVLPSVHHVFCRFESASELEEFVCESVCFLHTPSPTLVSTSCVSKNNNFFGFLNTFCRCLPGMRTCLALRPSCVMAKVFPALFAITRHPHVMAMLSLPESASIVFIVVHTLQSWVYFGSTGTLLNSEQLFY